MRKIIPFIFPLVLLVSCGPASESTGSGSLDTTTTGANAANTTPVALDYESAFSISNNGKIATIEGYLTLTYKAYAEGEGEMDLRVRPGQRSGKWIPLSIPTGTGKNQISSSTPRYDWNSLTVTADDGKIIDGNQKVRVTGKLSALDKPSPESKVELSMKVTKIEAVDAPPFDFAASARLVDPATLSDKTLERHFALAEGSLVFPQVLEDNSSYCFLKLQMAKGQVRLQIPYGQKPSQMAGIHKDFKKQDFKINDQAGKVINFDKPIKVYGMREATTGKELSTIFVERIEQ
jgi:hypothetical protein